MAKANVLEVGGSIDAGLSIGADLLIDQRRGPIGLQMSAGVAVTEFLPVPIPGELHGIYSVQPTNKPFLLSDADYLRLLVSGGPMFQAMAANCEAAVRSGLVGGVLGTIFP